MSGGFTPGPWYSSEPFAGFGAIKQAEGDALVFGLAAGDPDEKQPDEVCEANARLIAAAPLLFEAVRLFVEEYDASDDADGVGMMLAYNNALEAGKAALAQAKGE